MVTKTVFIFQYYLGSNILKYILTIILIFSLIHCEDNYITRFSPKLNLMNYESVDNSEKSVVFLEGNSPLKPILASLVIPGLGQIINDSPIWKTAMFAGIEIVGIAGYITWTKQADEITGEYQDWADEHWAMDRWVTNTPILLSAIQNSGYPSVDDVIIDGSHHLTIIVEGIYQSSDILEDNPNIDYVEMRDWDFYEGIGKYDQFVAGWDDALTNWEIEYKEISKNTSELIVMTPNKKHYLNLRNDSNVLYRNAKFALTAVVFNHIFSALDVLWSANKKRELSYKINVSKQIDNIYVIRGISVEWNL